MDKARSGNPLAVRRTASLGACNWAAKRPRSCAMHCWMSGLSWVAAANRVGKLRTRPLLERVVRENDKQRFAIRLDRPRSDARPGRLFRGNRRAFSCPDILRARRPAISNRER